MINPRHNTNPSARNEYEALNQINGGLTQQDAEFADYEKMLDRRAKLPSETSALISNLIIAVLCVAVIAGVVIFGRIQY